MASNTFSILRAPGLAALGSIAALMMGGCMKGDRETVADLTPAHAEGVTANIPGNIDGSAAGLSLAPVEANVETVDYVVQKGDSLSALSTKFGVSVASIRAVNGMTDDRIYYGKTIKVPATREANVATSTAAPTTGATEQPAPPPVTTPSRTPSTAGEKPVANREGIKPGTIPPVPPAPTSDLSPTSQDSTRKPSLDAAFGAGEAGKTATANAPSPRMPSTDGVSPFYDTGGTPEKSPVTPIPPVAGKTEEPKKETTPVPSDDGYIPLPKD